MLQKLSISTKCCYFEHPILHIILRITYHCFHKIKQYRCF